jgi:hypothetical protein
MTLPAEIDDPEWNRKRQELQDALLQAANELTTHTRCSRTEIVQNGIRVIVRLETFDRGRMQ